MKLKKFIFILLIIFVALEAGCSHNVLLDENSSKVLNYNFKISDLKNINKTLCKLKYSYSTNINKKYVAVITYKNKNASIKQYLVNNGGIINLTVPKNYYFIISLHANRTILYTWNIKNRIDNNIIKLKDKVWIYIPMPESEKGKTGISYDRQNFCFKPLKSGSEKIVMRYEHQTLKLNEYYEVTINVKIIE